MVGGASISLVSTDNEEEAASDFLLSYAFSNISDLPAGDYAVSFLILGRKLILEKLC
jgi:hypothetical protein